MPLHINHTSVTVVRAGKRLRVKPTGQPFDFTDAEVETIRKAGARIDVYKEPAGARVIAERTAEPVAAAETPAAKPKGKAKAKPAASDDDDDEGDL